jgi:CheY-like chemotaxis protein
MKVLIVDDNLETRRMLKFYLSSLVEETCECQDGSEALKAYTDFQPDWVLMDVDMPMVDGITATKAIISSNKQARVVIVTSYDDLELRIAAQGAGACGYVLKDNLVELFPLLT